MVSILVNSGQGSQSDPPEHIFCNARSMNRKVVYLIDSEGNKTNITHKPGIPYTLSAKDMGGVGILVEKDNKMLSENGRYGLEDIPGYL